MSTATTRMSPVRITAIADAVPSRRASKPSSYRRTDGVVVASPGPPPVDDPDEVEVA